MRTDGNTIQLMFQMQQAASTGHAESSGMSLLSQILFTESYFGSKVTISSPVENKPIYNTAVPPERHNHLTGV